MYNHTGNDANNFHMTLKLAYLIPFTKQRFENL